MSPRPILTGLFLAILAASPARAEIDRWLEGTATLAQAMRALCAAPDPAKLEDARYGFIEAFDGWQEARPQLLDPALDPDLASRVWFWPDKHGTSGRQMARILAGQGQQEGIVALGLGTVETVLFDPRANPLAAAPDGPRACGLALGAAERQAALAVETRDRRGRTALDPLARRHLALLAIRDALDRIVQEKLERPLGSSLETARGERAEAWRSGRSLAAIRETLEAVRGMVQQEGITAGLQVTPAGLLVDERFRADIGHALALLARIDRPLDQAVGDPALRPRVEELLRAAKELRAMVVEQVATSLSEKLGFNSLDGD